MRSPVRLVDESDHPGLFFAVVASGDLHHHVPGESLPGQVVCLVPQPGRYSYDNVTLVMLLPILTCHGYNSLRDEDDDLGQTSITDDW
jgi:hypothetical protein